MSIEAVVCSKFGSYSEVLNLQSTPRPQLSEDAVRVRVHSCGLAFPDVLTVEGKHFSKPELPFIPCNEVSGEVVEVGPNVKELKVGDRVFGLANSGGLAHEAILSEAGAYSLPQGVSYDVGAGFELNYGTTWHGLVDLSKLKKGETLLILGASGGVGMAAIDIAQALGCRVVACASNPAKLQACKKAGAEVLINYSGGPKAFKNSLKEAGVYGDIDVVYDPVGGVLSEVAMRALGWGGRFVVVGFASGGTSPSKAIPKFPLNLALINERQILGCFWGLWKYRNGNQSINRRNINEMLILVQSGKMRPVVSKRYPFTRWREAFDDMMSRKAIGKIVITMGAENQSRL